MSFRIRSKCLMKWREPRIKGMITSKNILTALILIVVIAIPFGFLGGNGKFSISIYCLALGLMSAAVVSFSIQALLPGTLVELREDMIVRGPQGTSRERSAYKDIDCVCFYRDCSYSWEKEVLVVNVHQKHIAGPNFAKIEVIMRNERMVGGEREFSYASPRSIKTFAVPDEVNLDQVLQILRNKGVIVVEPLLSSKS